MGGKAKLSCPYNEADIRLALCAPISVGRISLKASQSQHIDRSILSLTWTQNQLCDKLPCETQELTSQRGVLKEERDCNSKTSLPNRTESFLRALTNET